MSTTLVRPGKAPRELKNLGWLRRHWKEVQSFTLAKLPDGAPSAGRMVAHLRGADFISDWASVDVMLRWVERPTFRGVPGTAPEDLVTLELVAEPEDIPVRGNVCASGDDAADKADEDAVIARLEAGDDWAWAHVRLTGTCGDYSASDSLGGCTYKDERDFMSDDGYFGDMVQSVLESIHNKRLSALFGGR